MFGVVILVIWLAGCGGGSPPASTETMPEPDSGPETSTAVAEDVVSLEEIAFGDHRSEENTVRNVSRHPVETLEFFGLKPDMHVVEIWPAGGWYTEVIAPYVNDSGRYYAAHWDPESTVEFIQRGAIAYQEKLAERPDVYGNVKMTVLMPPDQTEIAPPESVDMVVTFRNIHNWMPRGSADTIFTAIYEALKPGGILGVVEHRGNPDIEQDPKAASGYVNQAYAIALAEKAGFVLDDTSEINANPNDTKDYEQGVWTLPPTLREGDVDKDKYLAIGESDRFTLKFRKPSTAG